MLDAPKTEKPHSELKVCAGLEVGVTGMQGWRLEMEDSHLCLELPTKKDNVLLGVFDGHGGSGAAIWIEKNLVNYVEGEGNSEWEEYIKGEKEDPELVGKALTRAFLDADKALRESQDSNVGESGADTSGCTSVVCIVTPKWIICANAGDSRCVLSTRAEDNNVKQMSFDHKPYDKPELDRIVAAGGHVQNKRVDGDLAVSRALGDFQFKDIELDQNKQKVSPEPDIIIWERTPQDEFLLLACDGLWDVMSNESACQYGRDLFTIGEKDMRLFAEEMIDNALAKGSRDNISAVAMKFEGALFSEETASGGVVALRKERSDAAEEEAARKEAALKEQRN